jgi:adenylosuccinate lyase
MTKRYTTPELERIWDEQHKYECWWRVELAVLEAMSELGEVPSDTVKQIREKAKFSAVRIEALEEKTHHDVIAFLENLEESVGEFSRWIHLGLTSYDVVDTALAILMKEAGEVVLSETRELKAILKKQALAEKHTLIVGRTHGVHAEPTSLGLKFLLWYEDMKRNEQRMVTAISNMSYGKISGACGNYAHVSPALESSALKKLGLLPAPVSTQVLQRDRHAQYLFTLALIATSCEKIAQEIRHLQRTEIQELAEPFLSGQKGSSAMPHKKNPILCERICGLARVVRANSEVALQNIALWGERDISNSAPERVIIPDSTILTHYMVRKMKQVCQNLVISRENMIRNLELTNGLCFSGRLLTELIKKGLARKSAYQVVQSSSFEAESEGKHLKEVLLKNSKVTELFSSAEIENFFNTNYYLRNVDSIFERVE